MKPFFISIIVIFLSFPGVLFASNGYFPHGIGAVNDSLGGAATAGNAQDLLGSLYRNPANATLFDGRMASVSLTAVFPNTTINSSVDALGLSGSTDSDVDVIPYSSIGVVFNDKDTQTAYYFAIIAEAGLHLDMPKSSSNPILMPQAGASDNPFGGMFGGFGAMEVQMEVVRFPFGISYQLNPKWSAGVAIAPSVSRLKFTPAAFAAPDDANSDGIPSYPTDVDHELAFGLGLQAGVRYKATDKLDIGVSVISPTWFEKFKWDVNDELGNSREVSFRLNRPLTLNLGAGYHLTPDTLLLLDCSWINYKDTEGFDKTGFDANGALRGIGWDDVWVLALGVQHNVNDSVTIRTGYNYCSNLIDKNITFFNIGTPLHSEHHLSTGASWRFSKQVVIDIGYTHAFESSQSGPWYDPSNTEIPETSVESKLAYDQVALGLTFSF